MKTISKEALRAWNNGEEVTMNEAYNSAYKLGTRAEHSALNRVSCLINGIFKKKLTMKQVNDAIVAHKITI